MIIGTIIAKATTIAASNITKSICTSAVIASASYIGTEVTKCAVRKIKKNKGLPKNYYRETFDVMETA